MAAADVPSRREAIRVLEDDRARIAELLDRLPPGAMTTPGLGGARGRRRTYRSNEVTARWEALESQMPDLPEEDSALAPRRLSVCRRIQRVMTEYGAWERTAEESEAQGEAPRRQPGSHLLAAVTSSFV